MSILSQDWPVLTVAVPGIGRTSAHDALEKLHATCIKLMPRSRAANPSSSSERDMRTDIKVTHYADYLSVANGRVVTL